MSDSITDKLKRIFKPGVVIAIVVILLEFCVFNFRHWQFLGNKAPIVVDNWTMSEGLSYADYNAFNVESLETRPYIELNGVDADINLLYFDFVNVFMGDYGVIDFKYQLELTDEGNAIPYAVPEREFFRYVTKTHYAPIDPYGKVHSIRLYFNNLNEGDIIRVNSFIINPEYSMQVSKKRMLALFVILYLLWLIRPGSWTYEYLVADKFKWKKCIIAVLCIAEILVFYKVSHLSKYYDDVPEGGQTQFAQLAEAIVDRGEVSLAAIPPEGLAEMADPYDATLRNYTVGENSDIGDMSDTGFYKGRYFVYFGVAPILLFYVPYYAITGTHIATRTVFCIISVMNCIGVLFVLYELSKRFFKKLPFVMYLMFSVLFTFGAGQMYLARTPDFYSIPIYFALSCVLIGMGFWVGALNKRDSIEVDNKALSPVYLAVGSLFMALPAASRPQFLIVSFLAIIIFWKSVFTNRELLSVKSVKQTIAFIFPYVLVAAGVMYYNYIRFGNVFDFGANYNLCYNNMPYRGWHIDRLFHATIGYLFYPCTVTNTFPYFEHSTYVSRYMGITADETLFGGIIYNNVYLILALLVFKFRKLITDKSAFLIAAIAPIMSVIVCIVDANMAGVLPRYYADFTWGFMFSAFIVLGYLCNENRKKAVIELFYVSFIITIVRFILMPFAGVLLLQNNKMVYYVVKNLVEFWY